MTKNRHYPLTRFGDVAREIREAEREPLDYGLERLIGLEHIEPENMHIKKWGSVAEGTSFTRVFRKGQVLFGKRRAYQRKVALAEFDGICSSDIIVMEAIEDKLVPELLPFIVQSEGFFEHALSTSAGSLSPRTKWKHLAEYKFPLPPKDEQRRIAEILWAADEVVEKHKELLSQIEKLLLVNRHEVYHFDNLREENITIPNRWTLGKFTDLVEINPGFVEIPKSFVEVTFLPMEAISDEGGIISRETRLYKEVSKGYTPFQEGDILFAKITPSMENGKGAIATGLQNGLGVGSTEFYVLRPRHDSDRYFIFHLTMAKRFRFLAERLMRGSAGQQRVPKDFFRRFDMLIPPIELREKIGVQFHAINKMIRMHRRYILELQSLRKSLLDRIV